MSGALHFALTGQPPGETVAEVDERLKRENHLDPRAVDDSIPEKVAEAVRQATMLQSQLRIDDVEDWIALLLDQVTQPEMEEEEPEVSPLDARSDDVLPGGLKVRKVLGHGATSRVLEVERDGKAFALKVSLTTSSSIAATRCSSSPRQSSSSPQVLQKTTTSPFSPT